MSALRHADRRPAAGRAGSRAFRNMTDRAAPPSAVSSTRPDLRLVPSAASPRRYLLLAVLLAALGVFGVVGLHAKATESAFSARELSADVEELTLRAEELRAEVAALESPEHVRRVATEQLGMVPATEPGYLVADADADPARLAQPVAVGQDGTEEG